MVQGVVYATHEVVRDLAEKLHHEARIERIYAILAEALEGAYKEGTLVANESDYFCVTA